MLQRTFDFLYLTEGKEKQKMGNIPFTKNKTKHRARRVVEVRIKRFNGTNYLLIDSGWDSGRYRRWKLFIVVWDGATDIGSGSKTKTRHNIVFV